MFLRDSGFPVRIGVELLNGSPASSFFVFNTFKSTCWAISYVLFVTG